ncbi:threonine/serine exporter family protein [Streptomyces brevispora]|uniref:threonine/serine exporter family protein n=1 Tax=Streptomyces brevispora TaxID=887462 RepID=UPI001FCA9D60|nr:threonine/serine exporter family protein [Streptomyces brevispora]
MSVLVIEAAPVPYPWWLKFLGIVLFALGFAPLMQPTWYEIATTAVLGALAAALAVTADRVLRLHRFLPLTVSTAVSVVTIELFADNPAHGGPVLLMLPALFYFVPGDYLSAATAELAAGLITTGALRLVYSVFLLVQLYVGVLLGVLFTGSSPHALFDVAAHSDLPRWALFLAWIVFTAGTLLAFATPPALLLAAAPARLRHRRRAVGAHEVRRGDGQHLRRRGYADRARAAPSTPADPDPARLLHARRRLARHARPDHFGRRLCRGFQDLLKLVTIVAALAIGLVVGEALTQGHSETQAGRHHDARTGSPHRAGRRGPA